MYATATTHLPHPFPVVVGRALGDAPAPSRWFPELRRTDERTLDVIGARSELELELDGRTERVALVTRRVVRSTVTASGTTAAGETVDLCLSFSPWDGGTAVVLSVDVDGCRRPFQSWSTTRRLEAALVRLAGELAAARSAVGPARP